MAIWDIKPEETQKVSGNSFKCPGCGSNLEYDLKNNCLVCTSCGESCYPEQFEVQDKISKHGQEFDVNSTEAKDEYRIKRENKHEIVCNSCGAVLIAQKNTLATRCAFCGSPAIVSRSLTGRFDPELIIPFSIQREEAMEKYKEYLSGCKNLPLRYKSKSTGGSFTPMFVPFWLVDATCNIDFDATGTVDEGENLQFYYCKRKGSFNMHNVPFDGSKKVNDKLMEMIEPYDYEAAQPYSDAYLHGMYADSYDLDVKDMSKRIAGRFRDFIYKQRSMYQHDVQYSRFSIDIDRSNASDYSFRYALLPVWFYRNKYKGIVYTAAVNGQTGKTYAKVPTVNRKADRLKALLHIGLGSVFTICCLVVSLMISISLLLRDNITGTGIVILCSILGVALPIFLFTIFALFGEDHMGLVIGDLYDRVIGKRKEEIDNMFIVEEEKTVEAISYMNLKEKIIFEKEDTPDLVSRKPVMKKDRQGGLFDLDAF